MPTTMALAFVLALSFVLALVPFGIQVNSYSTSLSSCPKTLSLNLERSEAQAIEPGNIAYQFLGAMAEGSGLSAADLITTTTGMASVATGMVLARDAGQKWGATAAESLNNIVEAADFPDWDTLNSSQQTLWGSQENYYAGKYVSLMNAFGFETDYERFETAQGSGGGNFEFSDDASDKLKQFYRIGNLWKSRLGVMFDDISSLVTDLNTIEQFPMGETGSIELDATDVANWPNNYPRILQIGYGNYSLKTGNQKRYGWFVTSIDCYFLVTTNEVLACSRSPFTYGTGYSSSRPSPSSSVASFSRNGNTCYWNSLQPYSSDYYGATCNFPVNSAPQLRVSDAQLVVYEILYGNLQQDSVADTIVDYPDGDVSNNQRIYYPENGVTPDTTWQQFTTPQTPVRDNETPFNPGNQTQTVNWETDTEENVLPLMQLPFDKLFPFCLLYDVPLLMNKIFDVTIGDSSGGVSAQAADDYEVIRMSVPEMEGIGLLGWDIEFDLEPVADLADLVKPVIDVLIMTLFLWASIEFWKAIITG